MNIAGEVKRVIDLDRTKVIDSDDMIIVQPVAGGTKKMFYSDLVSEIRKSFGLAADSTYLTTEDAEMFEQKLDSLDTGKISYAGKVSIEEFTDFNDMTELNVYYSTLVSQILNLEHRPKDITLAGHFRMEVLTFGPTSGYKIQVLYYRSLTDTKERVYVRSYLIEQYPWSEWERIMTNKDVINNNIFVNGNFAINQQGESQYVNTATKNNQYTVDMWRIHNEHTTLTVHDGYVTLSNTVEDSLNHYIAQYFEKPIPKGTKLTLSIKYRTNSENVMVDMPVSSPKLEATADWKIWSRSFTAASDLTRFVPVIFGAADEVGSIDIAWIKLEPGSVATQFVPPNKALELIECQRFYKEVLGIWLVNFITSNYLSFYLLSFTTMRTTPTVKFKNDTFNSLNGIAVIDNQGNPQLNFTYSVGVDSFLKYVYAKVEKNNHGLDRTKCQLIDRNNPICLDARIY